MPESPGDPRPRPCPPRITSRIWTMGSAALEMVATSSPFERSVQATLGKW